MKKIFLTGFVGRDPEERFTSNNVKVTSFPLCINHTQGGEKISIWFKISCWKDSCGHILPHVKKGSCVTVVGDFNPPSTYQNKKGETAIDMSVKALSIDFSPSHAKEKKEDASVSDPAIFDFGVN